MRRVSIAAMIGLVFLGAVGIARSSATKAEDNFQLVKVAEGVYAGIAQPGGLASGNAGFIVVTRSLLQWPSMNSLLRSGS